MDASVRRKLGRAETAARVVCAIAMIGGVVVFKAITLPVVATRGLDD